MGEPVRCRRSASETARRFLATLAIAAGASLIATAAGQQVGSATVDGPGIGPTTAPVTIVEYTDFASEPCRRLHFMLKTIVDTYQDRVHIVVRQDPVSDDPNTWLAQEAALAAGAQGHFWDMANLIFANQSRLGRLDLITMAGHLGLDVKTFTSDLDSAWFRTAIDADRKEAASAKVQGVPVYFLNRQRQPWPTTYPELRARVDAALAQGR